MKDRKNLHRLSLRLAPKVVQAIHASRFEGNGKTSLNYWVSQAIQEKLNRDYVREQDPPAYQGTGHTFYEFFSGGGMARSGLGTTWECLFANDFDPIKARTYRDNFEDSRGLRVKDVADVRTEDLPGRADLVWASFPCQDLSLAGKSAGLGKANGKQQTRSGTFWPFWSLMSDLRKDRRAPKLIVLENVYGALTSNQGSDFASICEALAKGGYRFGALVIDAKLFLPQSRPRIFVVAVSSELTIADNLVSERPSSTWHLDAVKLAYMRLSGNLKNRWIWWSLPVPPQRKQVFADLIEDAPTTVKWHEPAETRRLLNMMSPLNRKKVVQAQHSGQKRVGSVYRRTRVDDNGAKVQRAEVRFDDIAGCLRTPTGGSSRQLILVVEGSKIRSRLLSAREAARLMGLPDSYRLPVNYNHAYHLCGDGVVVPVVTHLSASLLEPIVEDNRAQIQLKLRA